MAKYAKPAGKLLDVGAAAGFFCECAKEMGWEAQGVEPSRWLSEWGKKNFGLTIKVGTLDDAEFDESTFDVLTMWDSIEHMPNPVKALESAHRCMKTGGILVINTPNIGSLWARLLRQKWWFLLSHHLYYFTPQTLTAALNKCGFEVIAIRRHYQSLELGHLVKMVGLYNKKISGLMGSALRVFRLESVNIPYYAAQMNVIARKS